MLLLLGLIFVSLFVNSAGGRLLLSPAQLPKNKRYDYIIVGAGPGGSVVANRLSEDPGTNVLLIEAGPSGNDVLDIEVPFLAAQLQPNTMWDWNFTTVPQPHLNERILDYPRGRVIGGSTSINFMVYTRGSKSDFDRYAAVTGDEGWSWKALQPYFHKLEHLVPPVDNHDTVEQIDPRIHGTRGPLNFSLPGTSAPPDPHIIATTQKDPAEFPFNVDMNSGDPLGIGWLQGTFGNGIRTTASTAYILPFLERGNFDVLINTTVTRLTQTGQERGIPVFRGVQFAQYPNSPVFSLNATAEIIVSAGAINTPQLLLLSGLGPAATPTKLSIPVVADLPAVGANLVDHPQLPNQYSVARVEDDLLETIVQNATLTAELLEEWEEKRQGAFTDGGAHHVAWLRIPKNDTMWQDGGVEDPSAGPLSPHIEFLFNPGFVSYTEATPPDGSFFTILSVVVSPSSRGSVTLASSSAFTPPIINPAFFNTTFDLAAMRFAVRLAADFLSQSPWSGFITGQAASFASVDLNSDESVDAWIRAQSNTIWHPVGTARMGRCESEEPAGGASVVNPDLTVKGTVGLRIVDASVLPFIPAAHPQAAVYVLAERAADLIRSGKPSCSV